MSSRSHHITTPEGVELAFEAANLGDRLAALLIDLGLIVCVTFAAFLPAAMLGNTDLAMALALLVMFVTRTFYFTLFEWRSSGRTPGKKRMGLRVIDARGGALTPGAIIARNLTRELEMFLPLIVLFSPGRLGVDSDDFTRLAAIGWVLVFMLLPIITRQRMRLGDLLAGTRVVAMPSVALLPDLARTREREALYTFSSEQLLHYGNRELQVLEDVLRRRGVEPATLQLIADKIRIRIGWPEDQHIDTRRFLEDFYTAQRTDLERGLLFGRRHADKTAARAAHGKTRSNG